MKALDSFIAHGWYESRLVVVRCGISRDIITDNLDRAMLANIKADNNGMMFVDKVYKRRGKFHYYTFDNGKMVKVRDYDCILINDTICRPYVSEECKKYAVL